MQTIRTGVLIIGAGGAGCRAAIAAADAGAAVILLSKRPAGKAGATTWPVAEMAGYNAGDPLIPGDVERHYRDMVTAGAGAMDERLAAEVAAGAPDTIATLERWGVAYERQKDGSYYVFRSCFASGPRTHVIRGHGDPIVHAMIAQMEKRPTIRRLEDVTAAALLVDGGVCVGAFGLNEKGEEYLILAGAVVMAAGGSCRAFARNLNPPDVSGDSYALAYEAGARLVNMEFMQAGFGFSDPLTNILNGYLWAGLPRLLNGHGEEFLGKDLPDGLTTDQVMREHRRHFPFSSSDHSRYLELAVHREICEGRAAGHGGVVLDLTRMTDDYVHAIPDDCGLHHMWPIAREHMKEKGVDLLKQTVEISCFAHAVNGGIHIDTNAHSTLPGLFAAGEAAGGPHGADRLGGNMMVTCQVFGAIAGKQAAIHAMRHGTSERTAFPEIDRARTVSRKKVDVASLLADLQQATQHRLLIRRNETGLSGLQDQLAVWRREVETAPEGKTPSLENLTLHGLLVTSALMTSAALHRKESRGSHYREDYPDSDPAFSTMYGQHIGTDLEECLPSSP